MGTQRSSTVWVISLVLACLVLPSVRGLYCHLVTEPSFDTYQIPSGCVDTMLTACNSAYDTCVNAATDCNGGLACFTEKMRCFENAVITGSGCSDFASNIDNQKLYVQAGGDYNSTALRDSCSYGICQQFAAHSATVCDNSTEVELICGNPSALWTPAPPTFVPGTPAPPTRAPNAPLVVVTIQADSILITNRLSTDAGTIRLRGIVARIMATILGANETTIVVVSMEVGSLITTFYSTDSAVTRAVVESRFLQATQDPPANLLLELATELGVDQSVLNMTSYSVSAISDTTPTPLSHSSHPFSLVNCMFILLATFAAVAF